MPNDVQAWIKQCEKCTKPLEVLAIDFTLLEAAKDGKESVLVMTDVFTKASIKA